MQFGGDALEAGFSHKAVHCGLQTSLCCGGEGVLAKQAVKVASAPLPSELLGFHLDKPPWAGVVTCTQLSLHTQIRKQR